MLTKFSECRGGAGLGSGSNANQIDKVKITQLIKSLNQGKFTNPLNLFTNLQKKKTNTLIKSDENWFLPGFQGVPGTKVPTLDGRLPDLPENQSNQETEAQV